ncbi:TLD-domain-containing protein [Halteromyces radiatus]|uniref:TLD-domain-containing protein n=1 Tax=Halteromyces radiatus TaxID=101107 RepID=UPI0022208A78|nr:TLD-domain-containing protein [Halteromyces radiatus]KAI8089527.1 TLD-domain-containing protein [Halteromyces radiatus]
MGNQSSQQKQKKNDEVHVKILLERLGEDEQTHIMKQFFDSSGSLNKLVSIDGFSQQCQLLLPSYYSEPLAQLFALYISRQFSSTSSSGITINTFNLRQCLDIIHSFLEGTTLQDGTQIGSADTFVQLYTLTAQEQKVSLQTFVSWIVQTGVQRWFEGSGRTFVDNSQQLERLVNNMLFFADEQQKQANDMDWLLQDDNTNTTRDKSTTVLWSHQVKEEPLGYLDQDATKQMLVTWYEKTIGFSILFKLVARTYFFGDTLGREPDNMHQSRLAHRIAPLISPTSNGNDNDFSRLLSPYDYFYLTLQLPQNALSIPPHERAQRHLAAYDDLTHERIFSSYQNGNSWQVFAHNIVKNQGATLLVIKAKDGSLFGGYADDAWVLETDWYGSSYNFLYQLNGSFSSYNMCGHWNATLNNRHYQYLCWGKKSLPNGLGMGGQLGYAGLWIESDFIHGHSKGPICSTYQSPSLCSQDSFEIDEVEVWLIRPMIRDENDDDGPGSILDRAEDMEFLEMAGKKLYSRDLEKPTSSTLDQNDNPS